MTSLVLSCAVSLRFAYSLLISLVFLVYTRYALNAYLFPPPGKGIPLYPQCLLFTSSCIYSNVSFLVRQSTFFCGVRWWSRRPCAHLRLQELQNYNLLLNNYQLEKVGSHQKKILHIQDQRKSPSKMVGGVKSCLESNPFPARDAQRAQTNLVCTKTQRPPQRARTVFECLLQRYRCAVACRRDRGSGAANLGMAQALLEEVTINPTIKPPELTQDWGNQLLEGTNRTSCAPRHRRKEQQSYKRLTQTYLWYPSVSDGGMGQRWPGAGLGGTECNSAYMGPFEGGCHYLHYLHHSMASCQTTGREHSPAHQQKIGIKNLLSMALPIRIRLFPPQSVSPIRKLS